MDYKNIIKFKAETVQNTIRYNKEMRKSLIDKIFFLDKVDDTDVFLDYGCADGAMLKLAHLIYPSATYIGFDTSCDMIETAKKENEEGVLFLSDLQQLTEKILSLKKGNKKICLSLMSLIHEVYSYGPDKVKEFWKFVFNSELFDYIAIRDMCVSRTTSRISDSISVAKIRMYYDKNMLSQWESTWGSLNENWSLVHFLLTYRYVDSWDRELYENYLPLCLEDLMGLIPKEWEPTYIEHYTLPFIRQTVKSDFDIDIQDKTHLKLILRSR